MYTHLHAHSFYSISDGLFAPKIWAKAIKDRGFKAQALTDHGTMAGLLPFYHSMKEEKLIPIMGVEFYFCDDPTDKTETGRATSHLILIAKNHAGWQNLMKLSRLSYELGFYYKPRVGLKWLMKYSEGLICLTACLGGVLSREIWKERDKKETMGVVKRFEQFRAIFGDDFYVEFQGHNASDQAFINTQLKELSVIPGFKPVITNDCHYINQDHAKIQGLIKASAFKNTEAAASYTHFDSLWLKKPRDVFETFREHHEYLPREFVIEGMRSTQEITEKCANFELPKKKYLPRYSKDTGFFRRLATDKLKEFLAKEDWRFGSREDYIQRFKKEYDSITNKGFQDYFLLVWDIIEWARTKNIMIGIGRGSSAGSFIAYLLGIVKINPLQYKLLFERFLNEHRDELPDIDLDFESLRRNEVKEYVFEKYGKDYVCEIGTYGRMMLKTAIIDFGKQFGYPAHELVMITSNLGLDKTELQSLDAACESNPKLKAMMIEHPEYQHAIKVAIGQIKSQSIHPAGVLICSEKLERVTPLKTQKKEIKGVSKKAGENRVIVTQAEDKHVIGQGLVKMDFLGLKEYDIFRFTIENAAAAGYTHNLTPDNYIDIIHNAEIATPDKKVWRMFRKGKTEAVFQFSSDGMKQLLIDMKADSLADLVAAVALYRPGCLENGWHTQYYRRKHGDEEVEFVHPLLEKVLADTYGVVIFQEQFMEVFHLLGEIPMVDADTIRSALGKKDAEKLEKFKSMFVKGATKHIGEDDALIVWDQLAKASGYTFNRCLAGREVIKRNWGKHGELTIEQMFKIKNDPDYAEFDGHWPLHRKYKKNGYGKAYSMSEDGRVRPNRIVDIRFEGEKPVFRITTMTGRKILATDNHKFPTSNGIKMLSELSPDDRLIVCLGYEKHRDTFRFGGGSNLPIKGQRGFQEKGDTSLKLFKERSLRLKELNNNCQKCGCEMKRKEVHHVDGDHGNQDFDNLLVVCPGCHKKMHYEMGRTKVGEKGLLTAQEEIQSIEYIGIEPVYDVEMEAPDHNFVVKSGIITCNSHSAVYAIVAYVSQWMKVHFPIAYWAAVVDWNCRKKEGELLANKRAAAASGVRFLMPDINKSKTHFTIDEEEKMPRWSLSGIAGIGEKTAQNIVSGQPYATVEDFCKRVRGVNINNKLQLAFAGAFDSICDRKQAIDKIYATNKKKKKPKITDATLLSSYHAALGFFESKLATIYKGISKEVWDEGEMVETEPQEPLMVAGMVSLIKKIKTKKGDVMAKVVLVDSDETFELTVFPTQWTISASSFKIGNVVQVAGHKSEYGGRHQVEVEEVEIITE